MYQLRSRGGGNLSVTDVGVPSKSLRFQAAAPPDTLILLKFGQNMS